MSLAQQPDDLKVTALNAAIRCLVAPLQLFGRVMGSEKNSTGHADDVATANGHNTPQSISQAIFLQITEAKASIRKEYHPRSKGIGCTFKTGSNAITRVAASNALQGS